MQNSSWPSCRLSSVCFVILLCLTHGLQVSLANVVVGASCSGEFPGTKYPNKESCRAYIVCNGTIYEIWYCPSGFYNPVKHACDLDYKCELDNIPERTTASNVFTTLYEEWSSTISEEATTQGPTISESPSTTEGSMTSTPSSITTTEESTTVWNTDLPTTAFSVSTEEEPFPGEITTVEDINEASSTTEDITTDVEITSTAVDETTPECETTTTISPPTTSPEPSTLAPVTTTTSTTTTTLPTTTTSALPLDPNSCPTTDSFEPIFLSHKLNCEKYYLCYHSKPIELHCLTGMYWNGEKQMCDYPRNVKCPTDGNNTGDANPLPKCNNAGLYSMPHPSRCEYFIMCMDGRQTIQQCDAFHRWDVIDQKCVIKDRATCILDITDPDRSDN